MSDNEATYIIFNNIFYNLIKFIRIMSRFNQMSEVREHDGGYKVKTFWTSG